MKVGDILSATVAKLEDQAREPQSLARPIRPVPDYTYPVEISPAQFQVAVEVAFERGFRSGWRSAIEADEEIDWDNFKVGGTD